MKPKFLFLGSRPFKTSGIRIALAFCLLAPSAFAQSIWSGGGTDNNWTTGANWGGTAPAANANLQFAGSTRLTPDNDFTAGTNFGSIAFNAGASSFTLGGNAISLGGTGTGAVTILTNSSGTTQTIGNSITISSGQRNVVGSTGATTIINGTIAYGTGRLFPTTTAQTLVLNGAGTGQGSQTSSFGLVSDGVNSGSTMRTNVAGTIVELGNAAALGTGWFQINNDSTIRSNTGLTGANAVANAIGIGGGNLTISGTNNIEFNGSNSTTWTGVTGAGSIINLGGNRTLAITNTGTTTISGKVSLSDAAATGRTLTVNVAGTAGATTISGAIVDYVGTATGAAGSFTKSGTGTLTLSGANTYTGATTVSNGKLIVNGSIINSSSTSVSSGATLGGSGTVGALSVASNGTVAPGTSSAGELTVGGNLTLAANSIFSWDLASLSTATPGTDFDRITMTVGNADITSANLGLNLGVNAPSDISFWQTDQTWSGILNNTGSGTLTGTFAPIDNTAWASLGSFSTTYTGNDVNLVWTVVPEPGFAAISGSLLATTLLRRRRRPVD